MTSVSAANSSSLSAAAITKQKKKNVDPEIVTVQAIYRVSKRCSGGADGGVVGTNGSIRPTCLVRMLRAMGISGSEFLDFGAGVGLVLFAAMAGGATKAIGYELPDNKAHKFVFDAVLKKLHMENRFALPVSWSEGQWYPRDIDDMRRMPGNPHCVYSFWVGMPFKTQEHILRLCARCPTVRAIAVFRDRKWPKPDDVVTALEELTTRGRRGEGWVLSERVPTAMYCSGEQHVAWIFSRQFD
uniref:Histone-lysine N-methyltransferase, H3 lysine-79 specific n=1 Tax=Cryptomonas curvata TaxID=233186 RepID=A0A6T7ZWS0_9CRYP|mmetsp:Transcript_41951/g.87679  ORF Transcript_41951/g.87679 Transcript_41951/m.87679 type:complete len:242 (+) Transcript_41951:2126-2851(+)